MYTYICYYAPVTALTAILSSPYWPGEPHRRTVGGVGGLMGDRMHAQDARGGKP